MFIFSLIFLIKNAKKDVVQSFFYLTSTLITIYVLFRIQFWAYGHIAFRFALLSGITTLILHTYQKEKIALRHYVLVIYYVCFVAISFVHADRVFYLFGRSAIVHENNNGDYFNYNILDTYSWFLYLAEKYDEAEDINEDALRSINEYIEFAPSDNEAIKTRGIIEKHGGLIRKREWVEYD